MPEMKEFTSTDAKMLKIFQNVAKGQKEQELIERSVGKALLAKIQGKAADLLAVYESLGGKDPVVLEIMGSALNDVFKELPVMRGIKSAREAALSVRIPAAAAQKNVVLEANPLTQLEGQALSTLAGLGGPEFSATYKLERSVL